MTLFSTATNIILRINQKPDVKNIVIYGQYEKDEVFSNIQFLDGASADVTKKLMEHPKEDGTMIVDHAVDDPNKISLTALIDDDDSSSLNEILDYYKNCTPVTIKIKNEVFTNLVMSEKPLKAEVSHFDKTQYNLSFKEIQQAITQYVKMDVSQVKQKSNASTVKTGQKQTQTQPKQKYTSILAKIKNWIRK